MPLTEAQIKQVRTLFGLPSSELHPNSYLRTQLRLIDDYDVRYGLTVIADVQATLTQLTTIETQIRTIKNANTDGLLISSTSSGGSSNAAQSSSTTYRADKDAAIGLKEVRRNLIDQIALDLDLRYSQNSMTKLRS
jgi:hypothetical protein